MNIKATANGAYLASLLACLPNIENVSMFQNLGLHAMSFNANGSMSESNSFSAHIAPLYNTMQRLHNDATSYDRSLSLFFLEKIPSADQKIPGFITPRRQAPSNYRNQL